MKKISAIGVSLLLFLLSAPATAQESSATARESAVQTTDRLQIEKAEKDRPVTNGLTIEKKITGRLPNGYSDFVTGAQKEEIYKIQKEYFELIELLKLRIELLEQESAKKVDALLTPEQVENIKKTLGSLESEKSSRKKEATPNKQRTTTRSR